MREKKFQIPEGTAQRLVRFGLLAAVVTLFVCGGNFFLRDAAAVSSMVNGRELPIYCVDTPEKKVALSFDAAWGNEDTAKILEILARHNVRVTFFMTGGWVESYPEDVKAILAAGHDLGNHSENHKNMSQLSDEEKKRELMQVHEKVKALTGYEMFLFRAPYGDYDNAVIRTARECGYYAIQWDVEILDINQAQREIECTNRRKEWLALVTNVYKHIPLEDKIKLYLKLCEAVAKEPMQQESSDPAEEGTGRDREIFGSVTDGEKTR